MRRLVVVLALIAVVVATVAFVSVSSSNDAAIPEPGALLLMGSGLATLAAVARRRMKAKNKKTALA